MWKHKPEPALTLYSDYSTGWALDESGVRFPEGTRNVFSNCQTVPEVRSTGDIPLGQSGRRVKLTTILLHVTMLKMCGAIPPTPHTSLCSGVIMHTYSTTLHWLELRIYLISPSCQNYELQSCTKLTDHDMSGRITEIHFKKFEANSLFSRLLRP